MNWILAAVSAGALVFWASAAWAAIIRGSRVPFLRSLPVHPGPPPRVSIVVAARNEEEMLKECLLRLLSLERLDLQLIAVDDRSDDGTGRIVDDIARADSRIVPVHITSLPGGWLGKNNALHEGARQAEGKWLLFTDGDVMLEPLSVARAVAYAEKEGLDHLTATPQLKMPGVLTNLFAGTFALLFAGYSRPWDAPDPESESHVGIGAFNLVLRETYHAIGGHAPIRLRPDDDMMLGKLVKKSGFRQDLVHGQGEISVEWYSTLGDAVRGLEKNAFAGMGYSLPKAVVSCMLLLVLMVGPYLGLLSGQPLVFWTSLLSVIFVTILYAGSTTVSGTRMWLCLLVPVGALLLCYVLLRASALTVWRGGISWRGTTYTLEELRSNQL
jgi:hypothetical protein